MNWKEAVQYAASLTLAGYSDWRLPTQDELLSLSRSLGELDRGRALFLGKEGAGRETETRRRYFPGTKTSEYWTSTEYPNNDTDAYYVDFSLGIYLGSSSYAYKTAQFGVRCVRLP
jgi:hypothetical protein